MDALGGGSDLVRVNLAFTASGIQAVTKQLHAMRTQLRLLSQAEASISGKKGTGGSTSGIAKQTAGYKQLALAAKTASKEARSFGASSFIGIEKGRKSLSQYRSEIRAFQKEQARLGTAIVGNPKNIALAKQNFRSLRTSLVDVNKAGIVNQNVLKTMGDGAARVGARGFTAFEKIRVQSFALKKDIHAVGKGMMDMGKQSIWAARQLSMNLTLPIVSFGAIASAEFLKVQHQFFQLQKVMEFRVESDQPVRDAQALQAEFAGLRSEIIRMSEDLGQSQAVMTGVFRDVAALGFNDPDLITGWATGISEIAAIGDVDLSVATEFFRTTNALFTEEGTQQERLNETLRFMEQFNAIADETSLQLRDLAEAFPEVAPVMQKMGFEASETASALAGMFKLGIPASEAAHALKFGFQRVVGPTKDAMEQIQRLNIEFFDMAGNTGGISQARMALYNMARQLEGLSEEEYGKVLGEIVGNRQTARWGSFMKSVVEGERELAKAMEDRVLKMEELQEINSDYMRGMLASGEITRQYEKSVAAGTAQPGLNFDVLEDPMARFDLAMEMYRNDPATQWNIMVTTFKNSLIEAGRVIVPVISKFGKKIADAFKWLSQLNPNVLKFTAGIAALTAAIGPMMVAFAVMKATFGSMLMTMSKLVPALGVKNLMPAQAAAMLAASPGRQDIGHVGNRVFQLKRGSMPASATVLSGASGASALASMGSSGAADGTVKSLRGVKRELADAQKAVTNYGTAGVSANKKIAQASKVSAKSLRAANTATFDARNAYIAYEEALTRKSQLRKKIKKGQFLPGGVSHAEAIARADADVAAARSAAVASRKNAAGLVAAASADATAYGKTVEKQTAKELRKASRAARFGGAGWAEGFRSGYEKPLSSSLGRTRKALRLLASPFSGIKTAAVTAAGAMAFGFDTATAKVKANTAAVRANMAAADASRSKTIAAVAAGQFLPGNKPHGKALAETAAASRMAKIVGPLRQAGAAMLGVGAGAKVAAGVIGVAAIKIIVIIGVLVAVIGALAFMFYNSFKAITDNWDKIVDAIQPGIDSMKRSFQRLKEILQNIGDAFVETIGNLLFKDNPLGGDKAMSDTNAWQVAATIIENLLEAVATSLNWVANMFQTLSPIISWFANLIGGLVGFIVKAFTLDATGAFKYFVKFLATLVQPITWIFEKIIEAVLWLADKIVWAMQQVMINMDRAMGIIPEFIREKLPFGIGNAFGSAANALGEIRSTLDGWIMSDQTGDFMRRIDSWLDDSKMSIQIDTNIDENQAENEGEDAGENIGEAFSDSMNETISDNAGKGVGDDIANNILKDFLSVLMPKLREQMDKISEQLKEAFQKNKDARLKVFEDQIKKIEDLENAEEKLLRTQEYLENKRELMRKRSLDIENYRRNRALAIYEGRISDVRQLDIDFMLSNKDNNKSLADLERERAKDLINQDRENAKERIEIQRQAEEEKLNILEKAFNDQLDTILQYAPRTIKEFEDMFGQLRLLMAQFGVDWPTSLQTAAGYYLIALQNANTQIEKEFGTGGENGIMAWVLGFINDKAWNILTDKLKEKMGSVDNALDGPAGADGPVAPQQYGEQEMRFFRMLQEQEFLRNNPTFGAAFGANFSGIPFKTQMSQEETVNWYYERLREKFREIPGVAPHGGSFGTLRSGLMRELRGEVEAGMGEVFSQSSEKTRRAVSLWTHDSVVAPAKQTLEIESPSQVFYRMGTASVAGFEQGIGSRPMWNFVKIAITNKLNEIATHFSLIGPKITQSLGPLGAQLSLWFTMQMSQASGSIDQGINVWMLKFVSFAARVIDSMGSFGPQMALWFTMQMTQAGGAISSGIDRWVDKFDRAPRFITMAVAPLGPSLLLTFLNIFRTLDAILPTNIATIASRFTALPRFIMSALSGLGKTILNFIGAELKYVRDNIQFQISLTAGTFSSFGQQIIDAITGSTFTAEGSGKELGKGVFNSLVKYINREILEELKFYEIPQGIPGLEGRRPFEGIQYLSQILHTGGIVGGKGATLGKEVMTTLQSGEGVLPINAMKKIGPKAFEALRRGAIGDVVAMAAAGRVVGYTPRIPAMSALSMAGEGVEKHGGDTYICVDTFIGEEEWFKAMADKYDMKVTARKAKANGSQRRVISSYNSNERNTYR